MTPLQIDRWLLNHVFNRQRIFSVSLSDCIDEYGNTFGKLKAIGSVAYKLGLTAAGQADIFASLRPKNEWDICAGNCIINEAGGKLIDLKGNRVIYNREKTLIEPGLIAGDIDAVDKTFEVLKA